MLLFLQFQDGQPDILYSIRGDLTD